jgi:hypothetical protein
MYSEILEEIDKQPNPDKKRQYAYYLQNLTAKIDAGIKADDAKTDQKNNEGFQQSIIERAILRDKIIASQRVLENPQTVIPSQFAQQEYHDIPIDNSFQSGINKVAHQATTKYLTKLQEYSTTNNLPWTPVLENILKPNPDAKPKTPPGKEVVPLRNDTKDPGFIKDFENRLNNKIEEHKKSLFNKVSTFLAKALGFEQKSLIENPKIKACEGFPSLQGTIDQGFTNAITRVVDMNADKIRAALTEKGGVRSESGPVTPDAIQVLETNTVGNSKT